MGVREAINQRAGVVSVIVGIVIVIGIVLVTMQLTGTAEVGSETAKSFYTIDDGKTWFVDDSARLPPFDHEGKPAYRCFVFTCDGGKTRFVSHLERYTPEGKRAIEEQMKKGKLNPMLMSRLSTGMTEFKKPGTGEVGWMRQGEPGTTDLVMPKCPDGTTNNLQPVWP